jgi:hypothetical protein
MIQNSDAKWTYHQLRPPWSGKGEKDACRRTLHPQTNPPATGGTRSRPLGNGSSEALPFPPPWRAREGSAGPRLRDFDPSLFGLFRELGPAPVLAAARHGCQRGRGACRRPAPPDDASVKLGCGRPPKPGGRPNLRAVQGGRPPLSRSLWPAEPPEEGEKGGWRVNSTSGTQPREQRGVR